MTTPTPPAPARLLRPVQRDREANELCSDFLASSDVGLARVEELLSLPARTGTDAERAHELFRVFHAIKGVAGMLKATDVTRLAHATEVLLGGARSEHYPLSGPVLQATADATTAMRRLLSELRRAVELDAEPRPDPQLASVMAQIAAAAAAASCDGAPGAPVP